MGKQKPRMSFKDAMDLVPDDLPDGAFFAMAHEIAGLEYGEGFDELAEDARVNMQPPIEKKHQCECGRRFRTRGAIRQHRRDKHAAKATGGAE